MYDNSLFRGILLFITLAKFRFSPYLLRPDPGDRRDGKRESDTLHPSKICHLFHILFIPCIHQCFTEQRKKCFSPM